jgi:hypothetical protein
LFNKYNKFHFLYDGGIKMNRRQFLQLGGLTPLAFLPGQNQKTESTQSYSAQKPTLLEQIVHGSPYQSTTASYELFLPITNSLGNGIHGRLRAYPSNEFGGADDKVDTEMQLFLVSPNHAHVVTYSEEAPDRVLEEVPARPVTLDLAIHNVHADPDKDSHQIVMRRLDEYSSSFLVDERKAPDFVSLKFLYVDGAEGSVEVINNIPELPDRRALYKLDNSARMGISYDRKGVTTSSPHMMSDYTQAIIGTIESQGQDTIMTIEPEPFILDDEKVRTYHRQYLIKNYVRIGDNAVMSLAARLNMDYLSAGLEKDQAMLKIVPELMPKDPVYTEIRLGGVDSKTGLFEPLYGISTDGVDDWELGHSIVYVPHLAAIINGTMGERFPDKGHLLPRVGYHSF